MIIYVHFILFEGIGKNIPFNSILDFVILTHFKMRTVIICMVCVCVCVCVCVWDCNYLRGGELLGWFPAS